MVKVQDQEISITAGRYFEIVGSAFLAVQRAM